MARLSKRDVEVLLTAYDDDPIAALGAALSRVLDRPATPWPELVRLARLPAGHTAALLAGDVAALDALARTLNERRGLPGTSA